MMPDISMCKNVECPKKEKCYRFMANPDPYRQAYSNFNFIIDEDEVFHCQYFLSIDGRETRKLSNGN